MKTHMKLLQRSATLLMLALVVGSVVPVFGAGQRRRARRPAVRYYTVPADTVIRVRMNQELNSKIARVGDRFSVTVTEPVHSGGTEVVADGAKIWGRVTSVKRAGRRTPGSINVSFTSLVQPSGRSTVINGSLASLDADDDVNADNEGSVRGTGQRKRDAVFIGGGAATGALIGAIAGGGKGAAIGAIIGGGLGTGARVYEKEKEAEVKSGTEFGVILNRAISLPASSVR
jgi:hypothetical protein